MTNDRYLELVKRSEELAERSRQLIEQAELLEFHARSARHRAVLWRAVTVRKRARSWLWPFR